ncbi:MAG: hypothetical protein EOO38_32830 [Cytophagaceae bacterium]|nr:MAG: hypothetical protein EOO38_32830 [Cytophagaceae bacterium]
MNLSDLQLEDLVRTCPNCEGSGAIIQSEEELPPSMGLRVVVPFKPCPDCDNGKIYTPVGMVLRDFVRGVGPS